MHNDDAITKMIDYLILEGGIEIAGVDADTSEMLYKFTPKVKDLMPELYEEHLNLINLEMMALWEKGYVEIDLFDDDPVVSLTKKSLDPEEVEKLTREEKWSLNELIRAFNEQ